MQKMQKLWLLMFIVLVHSAAADSFSTNVTVNKTLCNLTMSFEDGAVNYTENDSVFLVRQVNLTRTVNCAPSTVNCSSSDFGNISFALQQYNKDRNSYFDLYTLCLSNQTSLNGKLDTCASKPTYESELAACNNNLSRIDADRINCLSDKKVQIAETTACGTIAESNKQLWPFIGAGAGAIGIFIGMIIERNKKKKGPATYSDQIARHYT